MARFASGVSQVKQSRCMVLFAWVKIGRSANAVGKGFGIGSLDRELQPLYRVGEVTGDFSPRKTLDILEFRNPLNPHELYRLAVITGTDFGLQSSGRFDKI